MRFEFLIEFSHRFIIIFPSLAAAQETVGLEGEGIGGRDRGRGRGDGRGRGRRERGGERILKDMFYFYFIYSATPGIPASGI